MNLIAPYAKAVVGALIAGLASLQQALDGDNTVTSSEWMAVAIATLLALGVVWAVPNKDPAAEHQAESVQPPEAGAVDVVLLLLVAVFVGVVLILFGVKLG